MVQSYITVYSTYGRFGVAERELSFLLLVEIPAQMLGRGVTLTYYLVVLEIGESLIKTLIRVSI